MSTSDFRPESPDQLTDITINYTPGGRLFSNKYDKSTNLFKFFKSFSVEQYRLLTDSFDIYDGLFVKDSTLLIDEWERELGIPDTIFTGTGSILERQKDVIVKRLLMNGNRDEDYEAVAAIYGITIEIRTGAANALFPLSFPIIFEATAEIARNTLYIKFVSTIVPSPNSFPLPFPLIFSQPSEEVPATLDLFPLNFPLPFSSGGGTITKVRKIFELMKPATTRIIFQYAQEVA